MFLPLRGVDTVVPKERNVKPVSEPLGRNENCGLRHKNAEIFSLRSSV